MRHLVISISFFLCCFASFTQVYLQGSAATYAEDELVFYTYADLITYTEKEVARCKVAADGHFRAQCNLPSPTFLFAHLDSYFAYAYISDTGTYTLYLPEKRAKTQADKINPFFSETSIHLGIETTARNDINLMMAIFDGYYNDYYVQLVEKLRTNQANLFDRTVLSLDTLFRAAHNSEFENYKRYRLGLFKQQAGQQRARGLSEEYFTNQPILYDNTAYMELFHQVYNRYFDFLSRTQEGREIFVAINRNGSLSQLKEVMLKDDIFKDDALLELVILKNLYDNFYNNQFSRSAMLAILDSLQATTKEAKHKTIAGNIRNKVTQLMEGYAPPAFELYDVNGKLRTWDDFKGKMVYLNFCTVSGYGCLKEFVELDRLYKKYRDKVEFITVCVDEDIEVIRNFLSYEQYTWTFLHYANQPDILQGYDIRAYPTYFLIDQEGKISRSLAPSPAENVEAIFSTL